MQTDPPSVSSEVGAPAFEPGGAETVPLVSVVLITWNRPRYVAQALDHLRRLDDPAWECWVIDASADTKTADAVRERPGVHYIRFPGGAGHMTASRNEALLHVRGDIVAYLDDDALVRPGWLAGLRRAFADPSVAAVAGRTCNGEPGEEHWDGVPIGRLIPNGHLTGHFAAAPPHLVDIDHGIGANMSFRRETLARLGGFRTDYPGTALREDSDVFLRIGRLGLRRVFSPEAVVDHVAAPHVRGKRFDRRYRFWAAHNHTLLLVRNHGWFHPIVRIWCKTLVNDVLRVTQPLHRRAANLALNLVAVLVAVGRLLMQRTFTALPPERLDLNGREITAALSASVK